MKAMVEFVHARGVALMVPDLILDFGVQDRIAYLFQIVRVDRTVGQRQPAPQGPGIPVDPILFDAGPASRAFHRAGAAERSEEPQLPNAFGKVPAFKPAPVPLVSMTV